MSKRKKIMLAKEEARERKALDKLARDCKTCGESSAYAKTYGCAAGYTGKNCLPKCPHNK